MADNKVDIKISADAKGADAPIRVVKRSLEDLGKASENLVNPLGMVKAAVAAIGAASFVAAMKNAIDKTVSWVKEANALSKALGITVQQASILNVALGDVYLSQEQLLKGTQKIAQQLVKGEDAFKRLGVATRDSNGHYRNSLDIMLDVNTALGNLKAGTDRNVAGVQVYGKSWGELAGLLKLNRDVMEEARQKAERLNLVVGPDGVDKVRQYRAALNDLDDASTALAVAVGSGLLPVVTQLIEFMANNGSVIVSFFQAFRDGVRWVADTATTVEYSLKKMMLSLSNTKGSEGKSFLSGMGRMALSGVPLLGQFVNTTGSMEFSDAQQKYLRNKLDYEMQAEFMKHAQLLGSSTKPVSVVKTGNLFDAAKARDNGRKAIKSAKDTLKELRRELDEAKKAGGLYEWYEQFEAMQNLDKMPSEALKAPKVTGNAPKASLLGGIDTTFKSLDQLAEEANTAQEAVNALADVTSKLQDLQIEGMTDPYQKQMAIIQKRYKSERDEIKKTMSAWSSNSEIQKKGTEALHQLDRNETEETTRMKMSLWSGSLSFYGGLMDQMAGIIDTSSRDGFEAAKAFSIGSAVMNTAGAVMNALATVQPYPAAVAAAAVAAATGAMQIAKIASTTYGGGAGDTSFSVPGFSGGSASMGGSVGGSIGSPTLSVQDQATEESMQRLANSTDSASLALGRVADGMTSIADLFETDQSKLLSSSLMSKGSNTFEIRIAGTESDLKISQQLQQNIGGASNTVSQGLYDTIQGYIRQIQGTIIRSAVVMGTTADMDSVSIPTGKIRTDTNQSTKIQKQLEEWLAKVADKLAQTTDGLKEFTFYGESAFDAIVRLSSALQSANESLELIGANLIDSTLYGANAAYQLQELMGGSEDFTDKVKTYFESMFTEDEQKAMQAAQAQRQLTVAFNEMDAAVAGLNWTVPKTRQEFVGLVNGLDITTDTGRALFAALMDVAPAFDTVQTQLEEAADAARELAKAQDELNDSLAVRALQLAGKDSMAELLNKALSAESEILSAREQGLDVTKLQKIAYAELTKYLNDEYTTAADNYTSALDNLNSFLVESSKTVLSEWKSSAKTYEDIAASLKQARQSLMIGDLASGSMEDRLREAKAQLWQYYGAGMSGDTDSLKAMSGAANSYLSLARQYYASSPAYAVEYDTVLGMLSAAESKSTAQVDYAQRQVELQQAIIDKLQKSDEERKKEQEAQLREQIAQTQALMEGFRRLIELANSSGGSLENIESLLEREAAA